MRREIQSSQVMLDFSDPDLFGNEAAEEETPEILASYFVDKPFFDNFYSGKRRLAIIRARKGMGKSALLAKIKHDVLSRDPDAFILRVHGPELAALGDLSSSDPLMLVARWQQAICKLLSLELARRIRFARTDAEMTMVESAEIANFKGRNLIGALLE